MSVKEIVPRKIVAAAQRFHGYILVGVRHFDPLMNATLDLSTEINELYHKSLRDSSLEAGFVDQWGVFVDRKEALAIVLASGQPFYPNRNGCTDELYSEGVW